MKSHEKCGLEDTKRVTQQNRVLLQIFLHNQSLGTLEGTNGIENQEDLVGQSQGPG